MNILADRYQFRARIIPEFLAAFPLIIFLVASVEDLLVLGFLSLALFFVFFQGHFSSSLGRKLEKRLMKEKKIEQDGDFLCKLYKKDANDKYVLLLQGAAQKSGKQDPFSIDDSHERNKQIKQVIDWIIAKTRDREKFPTVFDKNCDYGFYRNMFGMRYRALGMMILAIAFLFLPTFTIQTTPMLCIDIAYPPFEQGKLIVGGVWFPLVLFWIVFWTKVISIKSLNESNKDYIKALLKSVEGIDGEKNSLSKELTS